MFNKGRVIWNHKVSSLIKEKVQIYLEESQNIVNMVFYWNFSKHRTEFSYQSMLFRPPRPRFQVVSFMTEKCHVWFWGCFPGHLKQCLLVRYCNYWIYYCKRYLNFLRIVQILFMDNQCTYSSWRLTRDPSSFGKGPVIELFPKYLQPRTSPPMSFKANKQHITCGALSPCIYTYHWYSNEQHWTSVTTHQLNLAKLGNGGKVNWRLAHRNWRFLMLEIVGGNWPIKPQWSILLRSTIQVLLNHIQHFDLISAPEFLKKSLSIGMLCSKVEILTKR